MSLPLSAAQSGIWVGQQLAPNSPAYNMGQVVDIDGPVDGAVFDRALRHLVSEADCLRVRFAGDGHTPRQILTGTGEDAWEFTTIDFRSADDPRAEAHAWMMADLLRPTQVRDGLQLDDLKISRFAWDRVADVLISVII